MGFGHTGEVDVNKSIEKNGTLPSIAYGSGSSKSRYSISADSSPHGT